VTEEITWRENFVQTKCCCNKKKRCWNVVLIFQYMSCRHGQQPCSYLFLFFLFWSRRDATFVMRCWSSNEGPQLLFHVLNLHV